MSPRNQGRMRKLSWRKVFYASPRVEAIQKLQKETLEKKKDYVEVEAENLDKFNSNLKTRKIRILELKAGYFDIFFHFFINF